MRWMAKPLSWLRRLGGTQRLAVGVLYVTTAVANASVFWAGVGWPGEVGVAVFDLFAIAWMTAPVVALAGLTLSGEISFWTFAAATPPIAAGVAWFAYSGLTDTISSTGFLAVIWMPIFGLIAAALLWAGNRLIRNQPGDVLR